MAKVRTKPRAAPAQLPYRAAPAQLSHSAAKAQLLHAPAQRRQRAGLALAGVACAMLAAGLVVWAGAGHGRTGGQDEQVGGPFRLLADDGSTVTERSFPGKYLLVYFGYTACRDVCPQTLSMLAGAMGRLGDKSARVQPLFITLDPLRDTRAVVHHYVQAFMPSLVGLTGAPAALRHVADEYQVTSVLHQESGVAGYAVDHSSVIYLMAPDGRFVAPIPAGASEGVMAAAILRRVS